jgi:GNAT superfamily N-acetyltransferase
MGKICRFYIRETLDYNKIFDLNDHIFPGEELVLHEERSHCFLCHFQGRVVGFGCLDIYHENFVFLSRAGVIPEFRGLGIHNRLIDRRIQWAIDNEIGTVITYVQKWNINSANNLFTRGFKLYEPEYRYGDDSSLYFMLELND